MNRYEKILKELNIENYIITEKKTESVELFFIKKKLDMRRMKNVEKVSIAVFKDMTEGERKLRGRADILLTSSMTDSEIIEKIKGADYSAGFVKNKYFEFPVLKAEPEIVVESSLNDYSLSELADKYVKSVYSVDNDEKAFINSFELFVNETHVRITSFGGVSNSYVKRNVSGEFVAQCTKPQDVETYQDFNYDCLDIENLKSLVKDTLKITADRAVANVMPATGNYDIVISDGYIPEIFNGFYLQRANAAPIYSKYSNYKIGDNVQGEGVVGDKVNIRYGVYAPFNDEGIRMIERPCIEDGVLKNIHGGMRFCSYLGIEQIGSYGKAVMPAGKVPVSELLNRKCLHIVNFSDFQMDYLDGHFKGEMRLAYLYDGKGNVTPVTGGSINGSIFDAQKDFTFSSETIGLTSYNGPKAVLLKNVAVAGRNE